MNASCAECATCDDLSGGLAAMAIVVGLFACAGLTIVANGRFGFMPNYFSRVISDRLFLQEYDRRLDKVILAEYASGISNWRPLLHSP